MFRKTIFMSIADNIGKANTVEADNIENQADFYFLTTKQGLSVVCCFFFL